METQFLYDKVNKICKNETLKQQQLEVVKILFDLIDEEFSTIENITDDDYRMIIILLRERLITEFSFNCTRTFLKNYLCNKKKSK